jgi:hypothetical protein
LQARPGFPNLLILYQKYRIFGTEKFVEKRLTQIFDAVQVPVLPTPAV